MTRPAKAFTLIELLAATVLSAGLMMGVMAVVFDLRPSASGASAMDDVVRGHLQAAASCIAADVSNAIEIDASQSGRIVLIGYRRLTGAQCQPVHRPVRIEYRVDTVGSRRCLIRYQQGLDVRTNRNRRRDLLLVGIDKMELEATRHGEVVTQWIRREPTAFVPPGPRVGPGPAEATEGPPAPATSREQLNPYDQIRWNGLNFYIKYVPDEILIERGILVEADEADAPEAARGPEAPEEQQPAGRDQRPGTGVVTSRGQTRSAAPAGWKLRLESSPVTLERTIWIEPGGRR
jgi:hypothetical protein